MKILFLLLAASLSLSACSQKQKAKQRSAPATAQTSQINRIAQGTYLCWQNSPTSMGGRRVLGEMTVAGNSYSGDLYGKGSYTFDPATKMVKFNGGGFDQRKNGDEWVGFFYEKGAEFLDGSGGKAANAMLIVTKRTDWEGGKKMAWIQQCDLK